MGSAFLVPHLDFSRSFEGDPRKATPESVAGWLKKNWLKKNGGGVWNYTPSMDVLVQAYAGLITLDQALAHCEKYWHPQGRIENRRVVRSFWEFTQANPSNVYKRKSLAAPIGRWRGRDIFIGIRAPLIRVAGDSVLAVMPIFRKNFVPDSAGTDLSLTAVREFCFREGYRDLDTELMCSRGMSGTFDRQLVIERGSDRHLYSADEFDAFATKYAKGVALLADAGFGLQKPNFAGYRVWSPDEPPFPGL